MRFFQILTASLFLLLTGCLSTPGVKDPSRMLAGYPHVNLSTCAGCHESQRPALLPTDSPLWKTKHGNGMDCVACHTPGGPLYWKNIVVYRHAPVPATCANCHEMERPAFANYPAPIPSASPSPVPGHYTGSDCVSCHVTPANAGNPPSFKFIHKNATNSWVTTCLPCHSAKRPAGHSSVPAKAAADCVYCHINALSQGLPWSAGVNTPHPGNFGLAACSVCHESQRPTVTNLPLNKGQIAGHFGTNSNQDCIDCHLPKTTAAVSVNPTQDWQLSFSHTANGKARTSCQGCHYMERPTTVIGKFSHQLAGMGDCVSCHTNTTTWAGAFYGHTPVPASCSACHASQRPSSSYPIRYGWMKHTVSVAGTGDCRGCHTNMGVTWAGGTFHPTAGVPGGTCNQCHQKHNNSTSCDRCHSYPSWGN